MLRKTGKVAGAWKLSTLAAILGLAILAGLANPNGIQGLLFPLTVSSNYAMDVQENLSTFQLQYTTDRADRGDRRSVSRWRLGCGLSAASQDRVALTVAIRNLLGHESDLLSHLRLYGRLYSGRDLRQSALVAISCKTKKAKSGLGRLVMVDLGCSRRWRSSHLSRRGGTTPALGLEPGTETLPSFCKPTISPERFLMDTAAAAT